MTIQSFANRGRSQRGAVLVHVAIAILGLAAFGALTIDYGIMWLSRRQAQNAADAAALAGAISLAFDDPSDLDLARRAAEAAGERHTIFGQSPNIEPGSGTTDADVIIGPCPPNSVGLPDTCVRVNVYRNQFRDPLPTFFARLIGRPDQGVRATATAQVASGTSSRCIRPWAMPDLWNDIVDDDPDDPAECGSFPTNWCWEDTWDAYDQQGNAMNPRDTYDPATDGFDYDTFRGIQVRIKPGNPQQALTAGWFFPIDLPREGEPDTGGDRYRENIYSCNSLPVQAGDYIWSEPGNMIGPTRQGVDVLLGQDPGARYVNGEIVDSCAGRANACFCPDADGDLLPCTLPVSPRLVPIPVFNVEAYSTQDRTSGRFQLQITRILGFFIDNMQGQDVIGYLHPISGELTGGGDADDPNSFLRTVILVR